MIFIAQFLLYFGIFRIVENYTDLTQFFRGNSSVSYLILHTTAFYLNIIQMNISFIVWNSRKFSFISILINPVRRWTLHTSKKANNSRRLRIDIRHIRSQSTKKRKDVSTLAFTKHYLQFRVVSKWRQLNNFTKFSSNFFFLISYSLG